MCQNCVGKKAGDIQAGLSPQHRDLIISEMPEQAEILRDLYGTMTAHLAPKLPVFALFAAMIEQHNQGDFGVLADFALVRAPLSLVDEHRNRWRTPILEVLHECVLSFRMSELTIGAVQKALHRHNLAVTFLCSCGTTIGTQAASTSFFGSDVHREMDMLRSAIDAEGNPVIHAANWQGVPRTMDIAANKAETRLLERVGHLCLLACQVEPPRYPGIESTLKAFMERAGHVTEQVTF
jgi:hypothetical protein